MGLTFERLGKYVRLVDERNVNMVSESVLGINIEKYFMPSVANVIGTDLSNYKLLRNGRFACNPMHVGRDGRLPVARYTDDTPAIVSPAYFMFEIIDQNEIEPEYLMLCFRRPDFDRMCWFRTDASVRGGITWDDVCALTIPVPSIDEQKKVVHDYQIVTDRISLLQKINENLEKQVQTIFHSLFVGDEIDCTLADICDINPTRPLKKNTLAICFEMATLPTVGIMPMEGEIKPYNGGARFQNGDTLLARITPCFENGKAAYINNLSEGEIAFGSTEFIVFASKDNIPSPFYYFLIRDQKFRSFGMQFMNGSSGRQRISGEEFGTFKMKRPSIIDLKKFAPVGNKTMDVLKINSKEIQLLKKIQDSIGLFLSKEA